MQFVKTQDKGRLNNGSWEIKKEHMLNLYINKKTQPGLSVMKAINPQDECCAEAYMETDYSNLEQEDFIKTLRNYVAFQFINNFTKSIVPYETLRLDKKIILNTNKWKPFKCSEVFNIKLGKPVHKDNLSDGIIPYVTRTSNNNGVECTGYSNHVNEKNAIIIGAEGFTAFYQSLDFITGNKINIIRYKDINKYNACFVLTILNYTLYGKFSYGYAIVKHRLENLSIKLPATSDGKPDWQFMENYIKSLPYSKNLQLIELDKKSDLQSKRTVNPPRKVTIYM